MINPRACGFFFAFVDFQSIFQWKYPGGIEWKLLHTKKLAFYEGICFFSLKVVTLFPLTFIITVGIPDNTAVTTTCAVMTGNLKFRNQLINISFVDYKETYIFVIICSLIGPSTSCTALFKDIQTWFTKVPI